MNRKEKYRVISEAISNLNKDEIKNLLSEGEQLHKGIGGTGIKLAVESIPIFAKKIPLTDIESINQFSTKNLFELPTYYQYGVGSTGFGIWRELKTHQKTTEWVLNKECENFPIMYGYAIIDEDNPQQMTKDNLKQYINYWGSSTAIGNKMQALLDSKQSVVVFLEYIPYTLESHKEKLDPIIIEKDLFETIQFMESKDMIHFDGHSRNILTDGERLYFADFGLATSLDFELSPEEIDFFHKNNKYDKGLAANAICHNCTEIINISPELQSLKDKYQNISDRYAQFIAELRDDLTKSITYQQEELEVLFDMI